MQRIVSALALMALAAPVCAQVAAGSSGIPDNAHAAVTLPHPAASTHANAMAGQADAARIEACGQLASGFLDDLAKGDFKSATSNFDDRMKAALSADKLGQTWQSLVSQFGKLQSRGNPQTVMYQGMPVVSTPLHFAKGDFVSQLACDQDGKLAGFYIRAATPAGTAPASATSSR